MKQHLPYLAATPGILACAAELISDGVLWTDGDGDENRALLERVRGDLDVTREPTVRLVVGDRTFVAVREQSAIFAVAFPTGHPVAKSIRRTIRRLSKREQPLPIPREFGGVSQAPPAEGV